MSLGKKEQIAYSLVTVNNITSIDKIASNLGTDYKKALKIVQKVIRLSNNQFDIMNDAILFKNAQIDHVNGKIILDPKSAHRPTTIKGMFSKKQEYVEPSYITVSCNGCGAKKTIKENETSICEFCGTKL